MTNSGVLNSWKEIANYLGRGVRTVQRWEQDLDLPVRRPRGKRHSAVIALEEDLDHWLRMPHGAPAQAQRSHQFARHQNHVRLAHNTEILKSRTSQLIAHSDVLRKRIARAISIGSALQMYWKAAPRGRQDKP